MLVVSKNRRAYSLVQLMVVISACSVILTLTGTLVHRAMQSHLKAKSFADAEQSAVRLFHQFREDVNRATSAVAEEAEREQGVLLRLALDDGPVEYRQQANQVLRVQTLAGEKVWREVYTFPNIDQFSIRREASPERWVLTLTAEASAAAESKSPKLPTARTIPVVLEAVARLGRDHRVAGIAERN